MKASTPHEFSRPEHGPVVFNGRYLLARETGVQRAAGQLVRSVDNWLDDADDSTGAWRLAVPPGGQAPPLTRIHTRQAGLFRRRIWEQVDLPRLARGATLVNLCNSAPLLGRDMVTMIHDAQIFTTPESYSPKFVAWYRFALPRIARRSRLILTVSEFSRRQLAEYGVAPYEKILVVHNGVDHLTEITPEPDAFAVLDLRPRAYVLSFASHQKHKNTAVLLRAFEDPALSDLKLVLVGAVDRDALARVSQGVSANVVFTGGISDGALRGLMNDALCLACPSTTEGFGLPPLEAMALGRPAVVAPCGALPELCADAALYAEPNRPEAWAQAFRRLADDDALWADYALRGREQANQFTWRRSGAALLQAIRPGSPTGDA